MTKSEEQSKKSDEQTSDKTKEEASTGAEEKDKKFKQEDHYLKVNKKILNIASVGDFKKSELLVYLHHCRSRNPKGRYLGCSVAGKNALSKNLNLDEHSIKLATKGLISKHLIKERPDVNTGYLKTVAIEVLPFPNYVPPQAGESNGAFSPGLKNPKDSFIQIPSTLIDNKALNMSLDRQVIFALLYLYSIINWTDFWGVDYNVIGFEKFDNNGFIECGTFKEGSHVSIVNKPCFCVDNNSKPNYDIEVNFIQGNLQDSIDILLKEDIFFVIPILFEIDKDEPDIKRKEKEIFKTASWQDKTKEKNFWFSTCNPENKIIIPILRPRDLYAVKTPEYTIHNQNREKAMQKHIDIISKYDFRTDISKQVELVNNLKFWKYLKRTHRAIYNSILVFFPAKPEKAYYGEMPPGLAYEALEKALSEIPTSVMIDYDKLHKKQSGNNADKHSLTGV